jgi:hypothetical protein
MDVDGVSLFQNEPDQEAYLWRFDAGNKYIFLYHHILPPYPQNGCS